MGVILRLGPEGACRDLRDGLAEDAGTECAALEPDTAELTLSALLALAAEETSLDEAVSEEEMPSSSSSCSKKDETGDSSVTSLLTALSLEAAALEGPSASPPGRAEDGTELACASDTGVLFRIPVRIKAAATATTRTMTAAS